MDKHSKEWDYPYGSIQGMLLNWKEMEVASSETALVARWDMDLAIEQLGPENQEIANTMRLMGVTALRSHAVKGFEWSRVSSLLFDILNIDGLVSPYDTEQVSREINRNRPIHKEVEDEWTGRHILD